MANHKWQDNVCVKCKILREREEKKTFVRDRSVLIHGVWEDRPVFRYDMAWSYTDMFGNKIGFERPSCITPKTYDD